MKPQLVLFVALLAGLANARTVSKKRDIEKREVMEPEDCSADFPGSQCVVGCPAFNRIEDGDCKQGKCCKPSTDDTACAPYGGACTDIDLCGSPKYSTPYRCGEGKSCCFEPGNLCGALPDNTTATCMVDCPEHNSMPGSCDVGECCRPPKDNIACDKEFGNCVRRQDCMTHPKYSMPARCSEPGHVCCYDPRFVMLIVWDTCYTRKVRADFYCLSTSVVHIRCVLRRISTNEVIYNISMEIVANVKLLSKHFEVPSCLDDYILYWEIEEMVQYHGYIIIIKCANGIGWKDPHMLTFGGTKYNFNGFCSYTLVKDCSATTPSFEITADFRGRYHPKEAPTRMVAVHTTVNGRDTYSFLEDLTVLMNGRPIKEHEKNIGEGLGRIQVYDDRVSLYLNKHSISLEWIGKDHEALVSVGDDDLNGRLCGILGDGTKSKGHDMLKSDGTKTFNATEFAESWLVPGSCPL